MAAVVQIDGQKRDLVGELPPSLTGQSGFDFENVQRNAMLETMGMKAPTAKKTGTTIAGVIFDGGVVLGADTRATEGPIVADKDCDKIHYIAPNIYCCGAGTSADTENTTLMVSSNLELHRLATDRPSRVCTALQMLKSYLFGYQGHVSAALVLGGVDLNGPSLYTVYPHGSTDRLPFVTMGSGSLAAMSVFESGWKPDMNQADAMKLVQDAIMAGVTNDLGSGGNVDITIITKEGTNKMRSTLRTNERKYRKEGGYVFAHGTTPVLSKIVTPIAQNPNIEVSEEVTPMSS